MLLRLNVAPSFHLLSELWGGADVCVVFEIGNIRAESGALAPGRGGDFDESFCFALRDSDLLAAAEDVSVGVRCRLSLQCVNGEQLAMVVVELGGLRPFAPQLQEVEFWGGDGEGDSVVLAGKAAAVQLTADWRPLSAQCPTMKAWAPPASRQGWPRDGTGFAYAQGHVAAYEANKVISRRTYRRTYMDPCCELLKLCRLLTLKQMANQRAVIT